MHPMLNIAVRAARRAGDIIVRHMDKLQGLDISKKGHNDYVSEVDQLAEQAIIEIIHRAFPDHGFLAEESGQQGGGEFQWVIDPLDGTTNYLHGYPQFGVSIALRYKGELDQAVIYDPMLQELYTASKGRGALLNDRRIRVSKIQGLDGALIGTGFPVRNQHKLDEYLSMFKSVFAQASGIRRAGAACLDLAHVASGRLDGFWEMGLQPWDIAAGQLLIQEAGGLVGDFQGNPDVFTQGNIVGGNPKVYDEMIQLFKSVKAAET